MDGVRNTFLLPVTAIVMHCAVIQICCYSGLQEEYVCFVSYCYCNALRCDIDLLPVWKAEGLRFGCLLLQL